MELLCRCPQCQQWSEIEVTGQPPAASCPNCKKGLLEHPTDAFLSDLTLDQCPLCGCSDIYRQKDFNRWLGVGLIAVGVVFSFFTYGISLLLVTIIDWILYRRVKEVGICYLCQAQFRGSETLSKLSPFNLVLHDHYRALR